jgi:hypothetical protein
MSYTDVSEGKLMNNYLPHHEDARKCSFTLTLDGGEWLDLGLLLGTHPAITGWASQPVWTLWRGIGADGRRS